MCGIVGAIAQRDVAEILLEGLRRLEYRGYDSEVNSFGSTPSLRGIDSGAYPQQRSFTLGLNVIF